MNIERIQLKGQLAEAKSKYKKLDVEASGLIILVRSLLNPFEEDTTKQETEKALVSLTRLNNIVQELRTLKKKISDFKEKIREKCRQVVSGVKAQGKRALNGMAGFLHLREGIERLRGVTEKMAGRLDALSESVEQEREISMQRKVDKAVKESEKPEQAGPAQKPHFTYQDEVQDFMGQAVAENRSYGSGADAFDAFMAYREGKGSKEQTGTAGRTAMQQPLIPAAGQAR